MNDSERPSWFRQTLSEQPALIVSALCLFASVIGLVHSWVFLRPFGTNVLQYSEIDDVSAVMVLVILSVYAEVSSNKVRDGAGDEVRVELADGSPATQRVLLGTTVNYIFVYDRASERVFVHPSENMLSLSRAIPGTSDRSIPPSRQEGSTMDTDEAD